MSASIHTGSVGHLYIIMSQSIQQVHLSERTLRNSDIIKRIRNLLEYYWEVGYRIVCATSALGNYPHGGSS